MAQAAVVADRDEDVEHGPTYADRVRQAELRAARRSRHQARLALLHRLQRG